MKVDKDALLAELGLTEAQAAAPMKVEHFEVVDGPLAKAVLAGEVVFDEIDPAVPARTVTGPVIPVKDLPIGPELFAGVRTETSEQFDAAYRKVFDAYKVHRKIAPGYNAELTNKIRAAMRAAQKKGAKPDGFVKAKAKAARG